MTRKSKQAGGNFPLTHYERTQKFASSEYGTVTKRVSGHSQYQLGDCALSLTSLKPVVADKKKREKKDSTTTTTTSEALCTPSGYLYSKDAILAYLLEQTKELKEQKKAWDRQQQDLAAAQDGDEDKKRKANFDASQKLFGTAKRPKTASEQAKEGLKRTSYWLADSQPDQVQSLVKEPPARPPSPHSQEPLKRKELWPVQLHWNEHDELICSVSQKKLHTQHVIAYWTSHSEKDTYPGQLVVKTVYDQMVAPDGVCPTTGRKIKQTRTLQRGGSSFAGGGQSVQVQKYRPTIT